MPILKRRDVSIRQGIANGTLEIASNPEKYPIVRSVISVLEAEYGVIASYISESVGEMCGKGENILTIGERKVHSACKIQIAAWQMGVKTAEGMRELANEIAEKMRSVELVVEVEL